MMRPRNLSMLCGMLLVVLSGTPARGGERALIDTTRSPHAQMYMVDLGDVQWTGGFWAERFEVCRTTMVPHLWEILSDDTESHAWANYRIAAGLQPGKFSGPPFNDGDFLKWFEALAQVYAVTRDPAIDAQMDRIIDVIGKAQREDGYLHTQTIIPQRQGDSKVREFAAREHFETYNMGHLMTAACVHYRATGKTTMLALARRAADYIGGLCRNVPADLARNAICPSHYMGVVELYRATREPRYLELAKQLIEIRNLVPPEVGSDQNQDRGPFREMTEAVGHAVRANYLYAGVADVVAESGDATLLKAIETIATDVATQKLYLTGMTGALYDGASPDGSTQHGSIKTVHQAYGRDYQLPNLTAYNETCATIGYALWTWRMLELTGEARYADLFEQALYNGVLPGISLEGKHFFYVNPLRKLQDFKWPMRWSRTRTPNIKTSFCCPPNVVRTIAEAHNYVYSLSPDTLWVHLYAASELTTAWTDGARIRLRQETDYPWSGAVRLTIAEAPDRAIALKLRIPGWVHEGAAKIRVIAGKDGSPSTDSGVEGGAGLLGPPSERTAQRSVPTSEVIDQISREAPLIPGSYVELKRRWKSGDVIELALDFAPTVWEASPLVEETTGQIAVRCGPLVYCLESNDLPAGVRLTDVALSSDAQQRRFTARRTRIANVDVVALSVPALEIRRAHSGPEPLYREIDPAPPRAIAVTLVPYFAWGNRGDTDMTVWLPLR